MVQFAVGGVFAVDYNVLVYPANEEISSYIRTLLPTKTFEQEVLDLKNRDLGTASRLKLGQSLDKAWDKESESEIEKAREAFEAPFQADGTDGSDFDVSLISAKASYDVQAILTGDVELLEYICSRNSADLVLIPVTDSLQGFNHMAIYAYRYGSGELALVHETLAKDSNRFSIRSVLRLATLFREGTPAVLRLDNLVTGASVLIDGEEVPVMDSHVLTTEGSHIITLVAQGYASRSLSTYLTGGEVSSLNATMVQMHFEGLQIKSSPSAQVIIDGKVVGETPMVLDLYSVPLTMRLVAPGYSDASISLMSRSQGIDVELKPEWMSDKGILDERKDGFYGSFARSLLIFGAKIALRAFDDGSSTLLSVLDKTADAAMAISIADLVGRLIDYYRQTEYIAR